MRDPFGQVLHTDDWKCLRPNDYRAVRTKTGYGSLRNGSCSDLEDNDHLAISHRIIITFSPGTSSSDLKTLCAAHDLAENVTYHRSSGNCVALTSKISLKSYAIQKLGVNGIISTRKHQTPVGTIVKVKKKV
jgi:hypothetical protein